MRPDFVELLRCPATGECVQLVARVADANSEATCGDLVTASKRRFPVERGTARP